MNCDQKDSSTYGNFKKKRLNYVYFCKTFRHFSKFAINASTLFLFTVLFSRLHAHLLAEMESP